MTALPQVRLLKPYRFDHPWIFGRLLAKPDARIPPGTVVDFVQPDGRFAGRGFYNARARVGGRILTANPAETVDGAFFARRIGRAIQWRRELDLLGARAGARLVHAEGDGLSGLVVDRFADVLAVQFFAAGMFRAREEIKSALLAEFPGARLYWFAEGRIQKQESFDCWEMEAPPPAVIDEHGVQFHVAVGSKHKTGFFADQRDNRLALAGHCRSRRVLDLCCHTGGFALYAAVRGGAREVVGVDLDDAEALPTARSNAALNQADIRFEAADVYTWLRAAAGRGDRYDVVILDPAKQTRSAEDAAAAIAQYHAMNRLAMDVVAPGGLLLTCSCSGRITEDEFLGAVRRAAKDAGREAQVFRVSGAAPDHPFMANVPEGRYLKAVWCRLA
jgi:23S rRNA (cytosine1962-C5)-methyltransferase